MRRIDFFGGLLGLLILLSACAPCIAPYDPLAEVGAALAAPSAQHLFGTDLIGRDVFSRVLYGGARTLSIGIIAFACTVLIGGVIGLSAGFFGGALDALVVSLTDALLAIPSLLIALSLLTLAGSGSLQIALAAALSSLPAYLRVVLHGRSAHNRILRQHVRQVQAIWACCGGTHCPMPHQSAFRRVWWRWHGQS